MALAKESFVSTRATCARRAQRATAGRCAGYRPSSSGGALCRPPGGATAERSPTAILWRARPRDLTASAITPAATAEVAHAACRPSSHFRRRHQPTPQRRSDPDGFSDVDRRGFGSAFPPWFQIPTRKRLTPRGGPRQRAVVGVVRERYVIGRSPWSMNQCPRALHWQVSPHRRLAS